MTHIDISKIKHPTSEGIIVLTLIPAIIWRAAHRQKFPRSVSMLVVAKENKKELKCAQQNRRNNMNDMREDYCKLTRKMLQSTREVKNERVFLVPEESHQAVCKVSL